ncbi:MAG: indole-3-glycerol phosphate synthase TrpC [Prevotella sp.]|nr:indole-3-glycerol phosphate synthase TrpC [Prevotella sp.]
MRDILEEIVAWKRIEVERFKEALPMPHLEKRVLQLMDEQPAPPSMRAALTASKTGIIAEFKRKSPSKGWIHQEARPEVVTMQYQEAGAAAVSILTDENYFGGSDEFIVRARKAGLTLPVLYKNFVIDEYQLFQAKACGASAVLLIAADLPLHECRNLMHMAHDLGMEVLLEMHSEKELDYADLEPDICGVNNRNLGSFVTQVDNSFRLVGKLPPQACKVSESGISKPDVVTRLQLAGYDGFLIGETFMKTENPGDELQKFIREVENASASSLL